MPASTPHQLPVITALRSARGKSARDRVEIEIDGETWGTCSPAIVVELRLFDGRVVDDALLDDLRERVARSDALTWCAASISRRALTRRELGRKLADRGHGADLVEEVLERCEHLGLLDDERYARGFVEGRRARGQGARRIRRDLLERGVAAGVVDAVLAAAEDEHPAAGDCTALLERRLRGADLGDRAVAAKAYRFLAGRGFSHDEITGAIEACRAGSDAG